MAIWRALKIFFLGKDIMLNKEMIVKMVQDFELVFKTKPVILAGAAMVLHGLKSETRDIDLYVPLEVYERLSFSMKDEYNPIQIGLVEIGSSIDKWGIDLSYQSIEGLHVHSLEGIVQFKTKLGREKDFIDIKIIEEFLSKA